MIKEQKKIIVFRYLQSNKCRNLISSRVSERFYYKEIHLSYIRLFLSLCYLKKRLVVTTKLSELRSILLEL